MKALAIVSLALLAANPEPPRIPAGGAPALCLPPSQRTIPRRLYERADKWQHDQRTIA